MLLHLVPVLWRETGASLALVGERLRGTFGVAVERVPPWFDAEQCYDLERGQYSALGLLRLLLAGQDPRAGRLLAITSVDLFIPVLTHVFGEAQLEGPAAAVSARRLAPEVYGLPPDEAALQRRLEIEAVHEVGHTFGLLHCPRPACAMFGVNYVEEIDLKQPDLCPACRERAGLPCAPRRFALPRG